MDPDGGLQPKCAGKLNRAAFKFRNSLSSPPYFFYHCDAYGKENELGTLVLTEELRLAPDFQAKSRLKKNFKENILLTPVSF